MSAAAMAGRVGGPTYLSGSSLGIAGAAASLGVAAVSVDRGAEEQAPSTMTEQANTDQKDFTITPSKEEPGQAVGAYPGGYKTNKTASNVTSNPAPLSGRRRFLDSLPLARSDTRRFCRRPFRPSSVPVAGCY